MNDSRSIVGRLPLISLLAANSIPLFGVSFVCNYLKKGEYARATLGTLMMTPYLRIFVMHITIIVGGFVLVALKSPMGLLLVLVVLKTFVDVILLTIENSRLYAAKQL